MSKSPQNADEMHLSLRAIVELHSEAKAEPISYCKGCSVVGVLTIKWPCPTITIIDRMMK